MGLRVVVRRKTSEKGVWLRVQEWESGRYVAVELSGVNLAYRARSHRALHLQSWIRFGFRVCGPGVS